MRTVNSDKMWKAMIHDLLEYIVAYHYPEHFDLIDWSKPYEFLNLELGKISPLSPQKGRIADVLVKLQLKDGTQVFFLFHIEVQGYPDDTMPQRVYQMLYRTEERYGICPEILVLYIDEKKDYNPNQYSHTVWETRVLVFFKTFKLLDNPPNQNPQPNNPYTMILELVYWAMKRNKPSEEVVMQIQLDLINRLTKEKFPLRVINSCLIFLVHYIKFVNPKNKSIFELKLNEIMQTVEIKGVVEVVREMLAEEAAKKIKRLEAKQKKVEAAILKAEEHVAKAQENAAKAQENAAKAQESIESSVVLMLQSGIAVDAISKATGLSVDKIVAIQKALT